MFKIEQVALAPRDPNDPRFKELLKVLMWDTWTHDTVTARGTVDDNPAENVAQLAFNYDAMSGNELELLHYIDGPHWLPPGESIVSHFGMHVSEPALLVFKRELIRIGFEVAQEVWTRDHTNLFLRGTGRKYHYVIMRTREVLGVDLKFIARIPPEVSSPAG